MFKEHPKGRVDNGRTIAKSWKTTMLTSTAACQTPSLTSLSPQFKIMIQTVTSCLLWTCEAHLKLDARLAKVTAPLGRIRMLLVWLVGCKLYSIKAKHLALHSRRCLFKLGSRQSLQTLSWFRHQCSTWEAGKVSLALKWRAQKLLEKSDYLTAQSMSIP